VSAGIVPRPSAWWGADDTPASCHSRIFFFVSKLPRFPINAAMMMQRSPYAEIANGSQCELSNKKAIRDMSSYACVYECMRPARDEYHQQFSWSDRNARLTFLSPLLHSSRGNVLTSFASSRVSHSARSPTLLLADLASSPSRDSVISPVVSYSSPPLCEISSCTDTCAWFQRRFAASDARRS
jgi:hypothetical protein